MKMRQPCSTSPLMWASVLVLTTIFLSATLAQDIPSPSMKVSLGAYKVPVEQPIFYEGYAPLIFEYQVPVYKTLDITLRDWRGKCETDNYAPSYTCPIFFHFERFLERFELDVAGKAWTDPTTNITVAPSPVLEVGEFCTRIQGHFKGAFSEEVAIEGYIQRMMELCPQEEKRLTRAIPDYVFNIKGLFKKMNDNFEQEFSNKFLGEANKKLGPAFYVNAVTSHQNGMLVAYMMEKLRWNSAFSKCTQKMIPESLLRPENISSVVADLNAKLGIGGWAPSLPIQEIAALYTLPLTDCTHVQRTGNFIVRVLIPTIRRDVEPKLYRIQTVPFVKEGEICQLRPIPGRFLFEEKLQDLQHSECLDSPLCHFRERRDLVTQHCTRAIFMEDFPGVKKHCPLDCIPQSDLLSYPILQQTLGDTFLITGGNASAISGGGDGTQEGDPRNRRFSVDCDGPGRDRPRGGDLDFPPDWVGSVEVKLPCNCHISFRSEILSSELSCRNRKDLGHFELTRLVPPHFVRDEVLKRLGVGGMDSYVVKEGDLDLKGEGSNSNSNSNADSLKGGPANGEDEKASSSSTSTKSTSTSAAGGGGQLGMLWALVILQLILILVIIGFGAFRWMRYQKEMRYSKERLVYNIYADPSEPNLTTVGTGAGSQSQSRRTGDEYMNHV